MAKSARELFEEAMRLDPKERATLMRLLIDTLMPNQGKARKTHGGPRLSAGLPS